MGGLTTLPIWSRTHCQCCQCEHARVELEELLLVAFVQQGSTAELAGQQVGVQVRMLAQA